MDLEKIYDEQVAPLMAQVIEIAKKHDMPFVASFQLTDDQDEDGPLMCTSANLPEECSERLEQAKDILYAPASSSVLTLTTRDEQGLITKIENIIAHLT